MSRFDISRLIGVPSVCPSKTPDRILTVSVACRWVTIALLPGTRRSRSGWMSASDSASRGGQPSITAPTPAPCDSPQVVTRNRRPQVFPTRREYSVSVDLVDPATSVDQAPGWLREGAGLLPGQLAGQTALGDRVHRPGERRVGLVRGVG